LTTIIFFKKNKNGSTKLQLLQFLVSKYWIISFYISEVCCPFYTYVRYRILGITCLYNLPSFGRSNFGILKTIFRIIHFFHKILAALTNGDIFFTSGSNLSISCSCSLICDIGYSKLKIKKYYNKI